MANGDNVGLLRQMFADSKERAFAWLFRLCLTIIGFLILAVTTLAYGQLQKVENTVTESIRDNNHLMQRLTDQIQDTERRLGVLTQIVSDHLSSDAGSSTLTTEQLKDHEKRIRLLEAERRPDGVGHN